MRHVPHECILLPKLALATGLATALALVSGPGQAATLRPYTTLAGGTVRLSDLFEGADDRPLGPGPAPGARIHVEAAQLGAIARMFHVDWRPSGPGDRATLERPGRAPGREDILPALRTALREAGAAADSEIELPIPALEAMPMEAPPQLDFTGLEFDAASGRFTTLLHVSCTGPAERCEGLAPAQMRLSGRVQAMVELPVLRRALAAGEVVAPADLQWTRLRLALVRGEVVRQVGQAEGQALRRPVQAGQPIALADLGRPIVVVRGQPLVLTLEGPGIALTAQGVANEPGGIGERIHVTNPYSRAILEAEVLGAGRARVVPGTVPMVAGAGVPGAAPVRQVAVR